MNKKILVSEDYDCVSLSIVNALKKYNSSIEQVRDCDKAYAKIKKALIEENPYDLLILDISYSLASHDNLVIKGGLELLSLFKDENIYPKVLIFSSIIEPLTIKKYYDFYPIQGFITKGSEDLKELEVAFKMIFNGEIYYPESMEDKSKYLYELNLEEEKLLKLLNKGDSVRSISEYFKKMKMEPSNPRTLQKRIERLWKAFGAKNTIDLLRICRENDII